MSEFEQSANQSAETVPNEPSIQQENTETQPSSPQESNYFTVKYNKEERQVSYDEAPDYIQKGLNYDKVSQRVDQYQQKLQDLTKFYGYQNEDELFSALEQAKQEQQRQQYEEAGINPDMLNQFIEQHPDIQYARELKAKETENARFEGEVNELFSEFPDLKPEQIPNEVWQLKEQKGLSLLDSYLRTTYKSLGQQKEQEALQKIQQNAQASTGSLGGGDVNHTTSIKNLSNKDFGSLVDQVLRGERKQL